MDRHQQHKPVCDVTTELSDGLHHDSPPPSPGKRLQSHEGMTTEDLNKGVSRKRKFVHMDSKMSDVESLDLSKRGQRELPLLNPVLEAVDRLWRNISSDLPASQPLSHSAPENKTFPTTAISAVPQTVSCIWVPVIVYSSAQLQVETDP